MIRLSSVGTCLSGTAYCFECHQQVEKIPFSTLQVDDNTDSIPHGLVAIPIDGGGTLLVNVTAIGDAGMIQVFQAISPNYKHGSDHTGKEVNTGLTV